jgi:hypothetical protein
MSRTVIDLDDEAPEEAAKELGTTTKRDTINTALREVTARYRRLRSLEEARQLVAIQLAFFHGPASSFVPLHWCCRKRMHPSFSGN